MKLIFEQNDFSFFFDDNILVLIYNIEEITLSIAKAVIENKLRIVSQDSYISIIDYSNVKYIHNDARELLSSEKGIQGITKCALISSSRVQKVMFNFFLQINKPQVPIKMYNNYHLAKEWLLN